MARRRQPSGRKRRTREHVIADLSANFVERKVLECGHVLEIRTKDYGLDATLVTFDADGEIENGFCELQLKATDHLKVSADGMTVAQRVSVRDLKSWLFELFPVILVVYDAVEDRAFWLDIQAYAVNASIEVDEVRTMTLRVPVANAVTIEAVQRWRVLRNRVRRERSSE